MEEQSGPPEPAGPRIATQTQHSSGTFGDPMLRPVISNGKDALNLLFEAAQKESSATDNRQCNTDQANSVGLDSSTPQGSLAAAASTSPNHSTLYGAVPNPCVMSTNLSKDLLETWRAYRFVTTGWLSAEEAVTYVDLYEHFPHTIILCRFTDFCAQGFSRTWLPFHQFWTISTPDMKIITFLLFASRCYAA